MRIAVVSDIHGNLSALEAVIADLRTVAPDLVVQGGDLVGSGSRPAEVIDLVRDLRWPGVFGNTDEMLWAPERLTEVLKSPQLRGLRETLLNDIIPATRAAIGEQRLAWLRELPTTWSAAGLNVVHASPGSVWRGPLPDADDGELETTFRALGGRVVVYGHIHRPFVRRLGALQVANSGSVSLSYDGDPRASYAVVDDGIVAIRRVSYDIEEEVSRLMQVRYPQADWIAQILRTGSYVQPPA
jgi:putative phosphoesterase